MIFDPSSSTNVVTELVVWSYPEYETHVFTPTKGTMTAKALTEGWGDYVLDVAVPRESGGKDWLPTGPESLLATGNTATVRQTISQAGKLIVFESPHYRLDSWEEDGPEIRLSGHGFLSCLRDHVLAKPVQVARSSTCLMALRATLELDNLAVQAPDGVGGDPVPDGWVIGQKRDQAVADLCSAGRMVIREKLGGIVALPAPTIKTSPDVVLRDGTGGTVVSAPSGFERAKRPNHVVVSGSSDGVEFAAEAYETAGPFKPARYGWVSVEVSGDAVSSEAQALLVARAELRRRGAYSELVRVQCVTDWRISLDQTVEIHVDGRTRVGIVTGVEMPIDGLGLMSVEVACG